MDLNNLNQVDLIERMPAIQPSFYPGAGVKAPTFTQYNAVAEQLGVTTLDTFFAPKVPVNPGQGIGNARAIPGNGIVLAGNAPTDGVYTGIQME